MEELSVRSAILELEEINKLAPQYDYPIIEDIVQGVYRREVSVPKGCLITSAVHKYKHHYEILKGECLVYTEEGESFLQAPYRGVTEVGTKRVILILSDLTWVTYHQTERENPEGIREDLVCDTYEDYNKFLLLSEGF